jgi:DNA invertase Pin-like site-specific DNA recombinase
MAAEAVKWGSRSKSGRREIDMKVALYARVSSEKQDTDLSLSAQLKALREYAQKNGYQVGREFVDEAESGRTADRPAFREMVSMARRPSKPFELILVWKYSRFARSREDSIVYKTMLRKQGVHVVSITEPFEDTPTGRLLEAMIESLDEFYSANLGQEIRRGLRESASRGFYVASNTPYGYRRVKMRDGGKERPKLEPHPHEAPVVAHIFKEIAEGKGLKEVAQALNREGIAAPGGKGWGKTTIHGILRNEVYTGTLLWGRTSSDAREPKPIRVENAWEAIIDRETFDRVGSLLKERAPAYLHPRRVASRYLLSGIARCGNCGKALIGQEAKGGKFAYYVCGTLLKRGAGSCSAPYLNAEKFENLVIEKIKGHILTEENLRELVRLVNEEMDASSAEYKERLKIIEGELSDINRRLDRLYDALETGKLSLNDLAPRIQTLRQRQDQLQVAQGELEDMLSQRRVELADLEVVTRYVEDLRGLLTSSSLAERKSFIKSFVKEVRVTDDEAILTYTMPLPPEGSLTERAGVLSIVHPGGPSWTVPELFFEKKQLIPALQQLLISCPRSTTRI